jgi:hypothetical protein
MENYKNVHVVMATVFHGSNSMNNFLFVIIYLQFYKSFYKEPNILKFRHHHLLTLLSEHFSHVHHA